jgi:ubiquinone/menaquinone biosynthesis C-methylase UbiE/uncharacterized protein YbaR (Trm112 family)
MLSFSGFSDEVEAEQLRSLFIGMRETYANGENAMAFARSFLDSENNTPLAIQIAYDLQAGSYVRGAYANPEFNNAWCAQLARLISPYIPENGILLEVGSGEATTLAGVLAYLPDRPSKALGFDISWSRCAYGRRFLHEMKQDADLFVADLFYIPIADASIDVVYTSHSLEPNGGHEYRALHELLRITKRTVILVEPVYELATPEAQARMTHHGYVRNLCEVAKNLGGEVLDYRLLSVNLNPMNPSGVVVIQKSPPPPKKLDMPITIFPWECPLTRTSLAAKDSIFISETGLVYPVLDGIPLLCQNHAILASAYGRL